MRNMNHELRIMNYKRVLTIISVVTFLSFLIHNSLFIIPAGAQLAPEFMITWKANSYAPPGYQGKILPTTGTLVELSFELIDNGKLANLSSNEIRWYVGNKLQRSGFRLKIFAFTTSASPGNNQDVRIVIPNYKGLTLEKTLSIPLVNPEVIIEAPYPDLKIEAGPNAFKAIPYFFNITGPNQLTFLWSANNIETGGMLEKNPDVLNLDITGARIGYIVNLKVVVQNLLNELEFATQSINFSVK